ncbi:MAG TPA: NADPH-dependent assimilatory sulfite reductase hemoprotein subunit [Planctomycetaceae bacterium]|nr:NADPH-dependent assimilatory sulfite reductase hemoprotein subunit [Planctomycetaceae bacterium]
MADEAALSPEEHLKEGSRQLRGTLAEELDQDADSLSKSAAKLVKFHGSYQQDNRDARARPGREGRGDKEYMFMVRTRIPGGKLTAEQFLAELDLCEKYGNGTLRVTTRQGFQLHGVLKRNLRETIREINRVQLTTLAACGDVERNVMCCPAPYKNNAVRHEMQDLCDRVAEHLKPRTTAYYEIWLRDPETGEETDVTEFKPVEEPIYGTRYLPRKFKTGFALPDDNCVDIYSNDLGFLAIVEQDAIVGYNVLVGGGMGMTPSHKNTFPAVAKRMAFVAPDQVIGVAEAIVKVQRDYGNRSDRKLARMKYLIAEWGLEAFKSKVEEYYGQRLPEPHSADVTGVDDHMGWHEQGDGRWFLGVNIENGRIQDTSGLRLKTGLRTILEKYHVPARTTPLQAVILCEIEPAWRGEIDRLLRDHGVKAADELSLVRRLSIACPALPTCGLSVTESERVMPAVIDQIEAELAKIGLAGEKLAVHMTGCPNGCARPYTPDIGLVGKAKLKYTLYLGGNVEGTRLAFLYQDMVPLESIGETLAPLFARFKADRANGESFGDFCQRQGAETLRACAEPLATA